MGAPLLSDYLWPDVSQGRQPQFVPKIDPFWAALGFKWVVSGTAPFDVGTGIALPKTGTLPPATIPSGRALDVSTAGNYYTEALSSFPTKEATILWFGDFVGAADTYATLGGIPYDNLSNDPYFCAELQRNRSSVSQEINLVFATGPLNSGTYVLLSSTHYITAQQNVCVIGVIKNGDQRIYVNNFPADSFSNSVPQLTISPAPILEIGDSNNPGRNPNARMSLLAISDQGLSDALCRVLRDNPRAILATPASIAFKAAGGGTNTPVNPGVGAIALTGYAPTLAQTANVALVPGAGSLAITGYAPSIAQPHAVAPGAGSIALTGYAPSVTQPHAVAPGVGSLAITGYAPTLAQTANQAVAPGVGSLALTGYAPSVAQSAAGNVQPGVGSLVLTGYAPFTTQTANRALAPAVGNIALTGYAPTVVRSSAIALTPGVGSVALTGYAPSIAQTANQSLAPGAGSVALTGYAPSVMQSAASQILIPGAGTLAISGYPPMVAQSVTIEFGSPMVSRPEPRNWTSSAQSRNWIARRDF